MSACVWCKHGEALPYPKAEGHCSLECKHIHEAYDDGKEAGRDEERAAVVADLTNEILTLSERWSDAREVEDGQLVRGVLRDLRAKYEKGEHEVKR